MTTEKMMQKWAEIRTIGKWNYIFWYGIVLFGVLLPILFNTVGFLVAGTFSMVQILISIGAFAVIGFIRGLALWHLRERDYTRWELKTKEL